VSGAGRYQTVRLVLNVVNSRRALNFYLKSGRLMFAPTAGGAPKPYVYLDLKRIKAAWLLVPKGVLLNVPPSAVLVEYETENADYYRQFSIPVEEVEKEAREGRLELRELGGITIVTEWDADEPMTWCTIDLRTGKVRYGSALDDDYEEDWWEEEERGRRVVRR